MNLPIRIVLPYPAGGVGDTAARMIADSMRTKLNRTVIVENKPGAAGRMGVQSVKDAPADGTVLLFTPIAPMALFPHVYDNLAYDPVRDFQPISQVGTYDLAIAVGANVPAKNLKELIEWLKANPAQAAYGTPGRGIIAALLCGTLRPRSRHRTSSRRIQRQPAGHHRPHGRPPPHVFYLDAGSGRGPQRRAHPRPGDVGP